jgi:hypothetical protein
VHRSSRLLLALLLLVVSALPVAAQTKGKLSLGWEIGPMIPVDSSAGGSSEFGLVWRLGRYESGWAPHWGLNWYETDLTRTVDGTSVTLGNLHVRPITAGYGYTLVSGRWTMIADVLGGVAFTSMSMAQPAVDVYRRIGAQNASVDVSMPWVLRPEAMVWYDLNKDFGLVVNVGYMLVRPNLTIQSSAGTDVRRINADMFGIQIGLAYSIF